MTTETWLVNFTNWRGLVTLTRAIWRSGVILEGLGMTFNFKKTEVFLLVRDSFFDRFKLPHYSYSTCPAVTDSTVTGPLEPMVPVFNEICVFRSVNFTMRLGVLPADPLSDC